MSTRSLFLAWQDTDHSRCWFPVGLLDAEQSRYRFRYTKGAKQAQEEADFPLLLDFPYLEKDYHSRELFPLFQNRVMKPGRPDFAEYLTQLGLSEQADPIKILSVDGGYRVTDNFEVFPKMQKNKDGDFLCRFFLHGWRYINQSAQERICKLKEKENLYVTLELTNPATGLTVQIQTRDYHVIGWAPRYLVKDLAMAMAEGPKQYKVHVVQINPLPPPSKQHLLIEMSGHWGDHEPMSDEVFKPLVDSNPPHNP